MSGTDEELRWADSKGLDHITWGLIDFSVSLAIFFWSNVLIDLYIAWGGRNGASRYYQTLNQGSGGVERGNGGLYSRLSNGLNGDSRSASHEMSQRGPNGNGHFKVEEEDGEGDGRHVLFDEDDDEEGQEDARELGSFRDEPRR